MAAGGPGAAAVAGTAPPAQAAAGTPARDHRSGLLLVTGHYRNGVLLAPPSAEWVLGQIEVGPGAAEERAPG